MDLSAIDVQQKTFRERFRGYDPDDVEDFLDRVVETLRGYEVKVRQQQDELEVLKSDVAGSKEAEEAIKRTYITAQRTSQEMITEAQEKADHILEKARTEADAARNDAKSEAGRTIKGAKTEAESILQNARSDADRSRDKAKAEEAALHRRVAQLRTAVSDLQGRMAEFAETAAVELEAIGGAIDLEAESVEAVKAAGKKADAGADTAPEQPAPNEEAGQTGQGQEARQEGQEQPAPDKAKTTARREAAYLQQPRGQRPWDNPGK